MRGVCFPHIPSSVTLTRVQKPTLLYMTVAGSRRYIRMHSSAVFGLCFMFVNALLYLPTQGRVRRAASHPYVLQLAPVCCPKVSKFRVTEPVKACYEQTANTFGNCRIHAYIFVSRTKLDNTTQYCVDPSAKWLPKTLETLKEMGINCTALTTAPNRHGVQIF